MADNVVRDLERCLRDAPGDVGLRQQWIMHKIRAGDGMVSTTFKVKRNGKFLSNSQYGPSKWAKIGTTFKTKILAIQALIKASQPSRYKVIITTDATIVAFHTYIVEENLTEINIEAERVSHELLEISRKKSELEQRATSERAKLDAMEQKIHERIQEERSKLLKKEQKLLRKSAGKASVGA